MGDNYENIMKFQIKISFFQVQARENSLRPKSLDSRIVGDIISLTVFYD